MLGPIRGRAQAISGSLAYLRKEKVSRSGEAGQAAGPGRRETGQGRRDICPRVDWLKKPLPLLDGRVSLTLQNLLVGRVFLS